MLSLHTALLEVFVRSRRDPLVGTELHVAWSQVSEVTASLHTSIAPPWPVACSGRHLMHTLLQRLKSSFDCHSSPTLVCNHIVTVTTAHSPSTHQSNSYQICTSACRRSRSAASIIRIMYHHVEMESADSVDP